MNAEPETTNQKPETRFAAILRGRGLSGGRLAATVGIRKARVLAWLRGEIPKSRSERIKLLAAFTDNAAQLKQLFELYDAFRKQERRAKSEGRRSKCEVTTTCPHCGGPVIENDSLGG